MGEAKRRQKFAQKLALNKKKPLFSPDDKWMYVSTSDRVAYGTLKETLVMLFWRNEFSILELNGISRETIEATIEKIPNYSKLFDEALLNGYVSVTHDAEGFIVEYVKYVGENDDEV